MCDTPEKIMEDNIIVQELDDYINENHLKPMNKLILRGVKHNLIANYQIQQDLASIASHAKRCEESPSLIARFKENPRKVIAELTGVAFIYFTIFYTVATILGLEELLKAAIP